MSKRSEFRETDWTNYRKNSEGSWSVICEKQFVDFLVKPVQCDH